MKKQSSSPKERAHKLLMLPFYVLVVFVWLVTDIFLGTNHVQISFHTE